MGQYYKVVFLSDAPEANQEEIIRAWAESHTGVKLMEHSYQDHLFMTQVESLLTPEGLFYKSRMVWAGDYADEEPNSKNLYHLCDNEHNTKKFIRIHTLLGSHERYDISKYNFIVNHTKKEYVDKRSMPTYVYQGDSEYKYQIHPLSLLTAEGNGGGGGDYHGTNEALVGCWARDSISMNTAPPEGYTEFQCSFIESGMIDIKTFLSEDENE